jgi:site-specific DNA-methyltransferase (adenine-specific)
MEIKELENKIINADCLDILRQLPDKCIDLVLTDPPYGIGMDGGNVGYKGFNNFQKKHWDKNIPDGEAFAEIFRVSKNQIIWGGQLLRHCFKVLACMGLGRRILQPHLCRGGTCLYLF